MYFKLAYRNVLKSYRDFFVYFMTLVFSVALFYIFGSFEKQSEIMRLSSGKGDAVRALVMTMNVMNLLIAFVFAFLILYANNFLIKRRKKEFGLYLLMGMPQASISFIMLLETILVGGVSLLVGVCLGLLGSQGMAIISGHLLQVEMNYRIIYSSAALLKTVGSFALIYTIVLIFNQFSIRRFSLLTLIQAERTNDETAMIQKRKAIPTFILGLCVLLIAYLWAQIKYQLIVGLPIIVAMGTFGTFLIFKSVAGMILALSRNRKKSYFKQLNMFVSRQLGSNIQQSYRMMAMVSILLLFGIAFLTTGINLNTIMETNVAQSTPVDVTYISTNSFVVETSLHQQPIEYTLFEAAEATFKTENQVVDLTDHTIYIGDRDRLNEQRIQLGQSAINVSEDTAIFVLGKSGESDFKQGKFGFRDVDFINLVGHNFKVQNDVEGSSLAFANGDRVGPVLFIDHDVFETISETVPTLERLFVTNYVEVSRDEVAAMGNSSDEILTIDRYTLYDSVLGIEIIFTYIGFYLGIVFLMSSGVVLTLQQLSEADDNRIRYDMIRKLGADQNMVNGALKKQVRLYFFIPLIVALIHTMVGLRAINVNLRAVGLAPKSILPTVFTVVTFITVYSFYYATTYFRALEIINTPIHK